MFEVNQLFLRTQKQQKMEQFQYQNVLEMVGTNRNSGEYRGPEHSLQVHYHLPEKDTNLNIKDLDTMPAVRKVIMNEPY